MNRRTMFVRRLLTVVGVVAALTLGVGSIQAAARWTAASAPLHVAPTSVSALQASLADEQARSAGLQAQIAALGERSRTLVGALEQAQSRVASDSADADAISRQMTAATKKLGRVQTAIARAERSLARIVAATRRQAVRVRVAAAAPTPRRAPVEEESDGG